MSSNPRDIHRLSTAFPQAITASIDNVENVSRNTVVGRIITATAAATGLDANTIQQRITRQRPILKARRAAACVIYAHYQSWGWICDVTGWWSDWGGALRASNNADPTLVKAIWRHLEIP